MWALCRMAEVPACLQALLLLAAVHALCRAFKAHEAHDAKLSAMVPNPLRRDGGGQSLCVRRPVHTYVPSGAQLAASGSAPFRSNDFLLIVRTGSDIADEVGPSTARERKGAALPEREPLETCLVISPAAAHPLDTTWCTISRYRAMLCVHKCSAWNIAAASSRSGPVLIIKAALPA